MGQTLGCDSVLCEYCPDAVQKRCSVIRPENGLQRAEHQFDPQTGSTISTRSRVSPCSVGIRSRSEVSEKCKKYVTKGFSALIESGCQWEFVVFLLSHYPHLHKFFGIEVLQAEHLEMNPKYQELGEKQVTELAALIQTYPDPELFQDRVYKIVRIHDAFNLTVHNYEIFFETTLRFLRRKAEENAELEECWNIFANDFCKVVRDLEILNYPEPAISLPHI